MAWFLSFSEVWNKLLFSDFSNRCIRKFKFEVYSVFDLVPILQSSSYASSSRENLLIIKFKNQLVKLAQWDWNKKTVLNDQFTSLTTMFLNLPWGCQLNPTMLQRIFLDSKSRCCSTGLRRKRTFDEVAETVLVERSTDAGRRERRKSCKVWNWSIEMSSELNKI